MGEMVYDEIDSLKRDVEVCFYNNATLGPQSMNGILFGHSWL